jgi:hypothetical protein
LGVRLVLLVVEIDQVGVGAGGECDHSGLVLL